MADKDRASHAATKGYVFKGGFVWKGGINSSASQITERPPPPEPLGNTGGVKRTPASGRQADGEASTNNGKASD